MRTLTPIILVVAVVSAGCSGLPVIGTEPEHVTVTPAQVPPDEERGLPPGVTESGSIDTQRLVGAHQQELANESVTINMTRRTVVDDTTVLYRTEMTHRVGANRTYAYRTFTSNRTGFVSEYESWINDEGLYLVRRNETTTTYQFYPERQPYVNVLEGVFPDSDGVSNTSVTNVSGDDRTKQYRIQGTVETAEDHETVFGRNTRENSSVEMNVDERGFIHEFKHEWYSQTDDTTARSIVTVRFHRNTTPPERPAWVNEAARATKNETTERDRKRENRQ